MKTDNNKPMIEAVNLTKRYEDGFLALDVLNLEVGAGEIYCLLGANGAGKTTTINLFLNLIRPTSGRASVCGIDVTSESFEAKKRLAYVSEHVLLYSNFTARENLEFFVKLGGKRDLKREDYHMALREVGLQEKAFEQRVAELSKGMRQKLGIAIAKALDPPVIILDEPTAGLDPRAAADCLELLDDMRTHGKSILMTTQDIFRAKDIANRVGIMKEGRKVVEHTRGELANENLEDLYLNYMRGGFQPGKEEQPKPDS